MSDEIVADLVRERLARPDAPEGVVLDGFPRTVAQARTLDTLLGDGDALVIIDLAVSAADLVRRLSRRRVCEGCGTIVAVADAGAPQVCGRCGDALVQRSDDREEVVRERLAVYERSTAPLVDFYRDRATFFPIDGARAPDVVAVAVAAAVNGAVLEVGHGQ